MSSSDTARPPSEGGPSAFPAPSLVPVPGGRVLLADRRTRCRWQVDLKPFHLASVPVTQALFAQVTGAWPGASPALPSAPAAPSSPAAVASRPAVASALASRAALASPAVPASPAARASPAGPFSPAASPFAGAPSFPAAPASPVGDRPVEGVSWWDAVRFCNALSRLAGLEPAYRLEGAGPDFLVGCNPADSDVLRADVLHAAADAIVWDRAADGYRLPTEAEWEHACRAGTAGPRYGEIDEIAWYRDNSDGRSHDVGRKQPNAWGLHDMLGNVWDWCWDVYDAEVYGSYRVLRGGGWFDEHWSCRASVRRRSHPTFRVDDVGFRVARSAA